MKDQVSRSYRRQKQLLQPNNNNQTTIKSTGIDSDQSRFLISLGKLINGRLFKKPRLEQPSNVRQFNTTIPQQIVKNEEEYGRKTFWTSYHDLAFYTDERKIKSYSTELKSFSYRNKLYSDFDDHGFEYYVKRQRYPDLNCPTAHRGKICFYDKEGSWIELPNPHNHLVNGRKDLGEPVFNTWKVQLPATSKETGLILACQYYVLYILHSPSEKKKYIIPIKDPFEYYFYDFELVQGWISLQD